MCNLQRLCTANSRLLAVASDNYPDLSTLERNCESQDRRNQVWKLVRHGCRSGICRACLAVPIIVSNKLANRENSCLRDTDSRQFWHLEVRVV